MLGAPIVNIGYYSVLCLCFSYGPCADNIHAAVLEMVEVFPEVIKQIFNFILITPQMKFQSLI